MPDEAQIQLLTAQDGSLYRDLRLRALQTDPQVFLATFEEESQKPLLAFQHDLEFAISSPIWGYYGIFHQQQLVGFCQISHTAFSKHAHLAHLYNLYIAPEFRRQGYGHHLITYVIEKLISHQVELLVITHLGNNTRAHQFYESLGFQDCGRLPNSIKWQGQYDDEVQMYLKLEK